MVKLRILTISNITIIIALMLLNATGLKLPFMLGVLLISIAVAAVTRYQGGKFRDGTFVLIFIFCMIFLYAHSK